MESSRENQLRQLIIDNPDLEIMPFVSTEIPREYAPYMAGEIGTSRIDEWTVNPYDDEMILFKSSGWSEIESEYFDNDPHERCSVPDAEIEAYFNNLPWKKVIALFVEAM